jgi:hypothetical protein
MLLGLLAGVVQMWCAKRCYSTTTTFAALEGHDGGL